MATRLSPPPLVGERRFSALVALLLAVFALLLAAPAFADPTPSFPPLTGRVVDDAHILSPEVQADLTAKLAALEAKNGDQLVVVTVPSLQGMEISDYGYQLGRAWGIGQKGKNNGALFIVAPNEKKVRVEVGYGLEPVLTDAMSSVILNSQVLPRFRQGDIAGGVVAGTDALVEQLGLTPQEAQARLQQADEQAQAQEERPPERHEVIGTIFSILIFVFVISAFFRGGRRGGGMGWVLPLMFLGGGFGGRDRDDGWGGGGGGGGFSGGGGSFGGGGASGGW